ncbi:Ig-like domain-containing protein [Deinococcus aerophilus]|uniref:Peptidase C-terminal archaeal/bacterial domain-containing protein n=1 Tax=Deinococcus aerophilus TaxID=522488 RepID=A0ABQ2GIY9_9DEIO|nr:Ig-like domain-containing protein [Deinococcus aerophilus]GGL97486.1 hypothetical protein GCM10010841_02330 [Deinococcus aerophilus]
MKRSPSLVLLTLTGLLLSACSGITPAPTDATKPTVSLTAAPTTITAAGSVTLTADAKDDVGIAKVTFYRGNTEIGSDTTAPYTLSAAVTAADNGTVGYRAVATDAAGNSAESSASVIVDIDVTKPTISLAAAPTTVTTAGNVTLVAAASDNVAVTKVTFYRGNTEIGSDTTAPYTLSAAVTAADNGTVGYRAVATDAAGNSAESSASVTVNIDATMPTVSLTATPTTITAAGSVTLTADAKDDVGITKVTFYRGNTEIGSDTTAPYTLSAAVTAADNGTVGYRAVAIDTAGNSAESSASVIVNIDVIKPTVSLTATPTTVTTAGNVTLVAAASDNVAVTKVTFYRGNTEIGSDTTAPYTLSAAVTAADNGTVGYRAVATDAAGNSAESSASVIVDIDVIKPTVSLMAAPTTVTTAGNVTLTANASDNVGVTKVDFYDNNVLIGTDMNAPFSMSRTYTYADNGTHTIKAVASDAQGNVAETSTTVTVAIADANEPNDSLTAATPLLIGTPLNGAIAAQGRDFDYFKFEAVSGDMLKLTVKSVSVDPKSTLDPYVQILMPDGKTVLEADDDSGTGLESEIRFNVPQTGTYIVVVTSFNIHDDAQATDDKATNTYQIALTRR